MITPAGIRGGAAAAGVGAIDYIVVNQGGAVEEFDYGGQFYGAPCVPTASCGVSMTKKQ
jgi:hypothetical protein